MKEKNALLSSGISGRALYATSPCCMPADELAASSREGRLAGRYVDPTISRRRADNGAYDDGRRRVEAK